MKNFVLFLREIAETNKKLKDILAEQMWEAEKKYENYLTLAIKHIDAHKYDQKLLFAQNDIIRQNLGADVRSMQNLIGV